jgi:dUTPase
MSENEVRDLVKQLIKAVEEEKPQPKEEEKPKPKVEVILPASPAKDYESPLFHKVATKIVVDDPMFMPQYTPGCSYVSLRANLSNRGAIRLPFRGIETVDCGFDLELSYGYRSVLVQNRLLAAKGLLLTGPRLLDGSQRVQVTIINCGHQIIEIHNGDLIAEMSIEPVYLFDFQE